ncbi:hypothetical protein ACIRD2_33795 [Streptomyces sp. NPDC093595]|uniref:hypothetical protein n=1 Tax=Streptomyces sp. NPDC093595 TaxID=3366045 RepID=UPI003805DCDE
MSTPIRGDDDGVARRRARVLRLETLRDIEALQRELQALHGQLLACGDGEGERLRELLHTAGATTGVWLDDVACRFAETDHDADELFARAWQFVDDLPIEPGGFLSREDVSLFTTLRGSAAGMLARLWITGYLIGPVPEDAWPNQELATLLLEALEHHADAVALTEALDHHHGPSQEAGEPNREKSETDDQPGEPEGEPS